MTSDRRQVVCVLSGMGGVGKSETVLQFLDKNDGAICERYGYCLSSDSSG
jgi:MinD superfamily P-loop ATPase